MVPGVRVLESTTNRTRFVEMMANAVENGLFVPATTSARTRCRTSTRKARPTTAIRSAHPESEITLEVDVGDYVELKRAALACHSSQVTDSSFFLQMPIEVFRQAFGKRMVHRARQHATDACGLVVRHGGGRPPA